MRAILISAVLVLASFCLVSGQGIVVDAVDGLVGGEIEDGATLTFHMRVTGDGTNHLMLNNGFTFSSADLAWGDVVGEFNPALVPDLEAWFDFIMTINYWKTGSLADTVGIGLLSLFGSGLPAGFDDVAFSFTVGPITGPGGGVLTVDSSWYPPSNPWMWDVVGTDVAWGGPYSYTMGGFVPPPYTYCTPQPTILKETGNVLYVHLENEDVGNVDLASLRVQSKIPPYEPAYIADGEVVTSCFIFRFLGSSGFRPITGSFEATYTLDYNYLDGTPAPQLVGDFALLVLPGDVSLDGVVNIDDMVFLSDFFWNDGDVTTADNTKLPELMDVDQNGNVNPRDVLELKNILGM